MANIDDCLKGATDKKTAEQLGLELTHTADGFRARFTASGAYPLGQAEKMAQEAALAAKAADIARVRRQKGLQTLAMHRAMLQVKEHPSGIQTGIMSLLVKDLGGRAGFSNVDFRAKAILGQYHAHFAEGLQKLRTTLFGLRQDSELARKVVREVFGENSGDDQARGIAKAWADTAEEARARFNQAGGAIPRRQDWGLPQVHDNLLVGKATREEWTRFVDDLVDHEKILDVDGRPMGDLERQLMLDRMYDTIRTDGLSDIVAEGRGRMGVDGAGLANRHRDHRVLVFKDADSWMKYMDRFGPKDVYATMTDHLHRMAQETALMEIMGPNPHSTYRYLRDYALTQGMGEKSAWFLDNVFDEVTGRINAARSATLADFGKSVRNFLAASKLGAAMLSALSDIAFVNRTAAWNGLPYTRIFRRQLSLLNPANEADRLFAVRQGLIADAWVTRALAANRFTEVTGADWTARLADFTMRASGMNAWTDAGKKAFGMEFQAFLADNADKALAQLPAPMKRAFKRHGITGEMWDAVRLGDSFIDHEGARFFSPDRVMQRADLEEGVKKDFAAKFQEMILTETNYAVPEPDSRAMAIVHMGTQRGSVVGELWRGGMLFKTFPITAITNHMYRGALATGLKSKAHYLAMITISTTTLGALALQLKDISKGRDPRPMDDPKFWAAAFVQGGGAGIYGDFLFSDVNRFGQGPYKTFTSGPMGELIDQSIGLTYGNVQQMIKGEDANVAGDVVGFARRYSPGISLWYTRLAYERLVLDQLEELADGSAARARWSRRESKMLREYGSRYWWESGEAAPDRAPDIGNITGE
jgi:hypothetical protein